MNELKTYRVEVKKVQTFAVETTGVSTSQVEREMTPEKVDQLIRLIRPSKEEVIVSSAPILSRDTRRTGIGVRETDNYRLDNDGA